MTINPKIALRVVTSTLTLISLVLLLVFINNFISAIVFAALTTFFFLVSVVSWKLGDLNALPELKARLESDLKK